jgi:hypothetical protein
MLFAKIFWIRIWVFLTPGSQWAVWGENINPCSFADEATLASSPMSVLGLKQSQ